METLAQFLYVVFVKITFLMQDFGCVQSRKLGLGLFGDGRWLPEDLKRLRQLRHKFPGVEASARGAFNEMGPICPELVIEN
jgi:hypothetical protein